MQAQRAFWPFGLAVLAVCAAPSFAQTIFDSAGFEPGAGYSTAFVNSNEPNVHGNLRGQPSTGGNPWTYVSTDPNTQSTTNASAVIVSSGPNTPAIGAQSVQVTRSQALANSWWLVPVNYTPAPSNQIIRVVWSMDTTGIQSNPSQFGPFFGIDAYSNGTIQNGRLGGAGIDASTGKFLYEYTPPASSPTFGTGPVVGTGWHNYELDFNFASDTYSASVDGTQEVSGINFITTGASVFSDADIATLQDDVASPNPTGAAFFDNYSISAVPEPASMWLGLLACGLLVRRRRSG